MPIPRCLVVKKESKKSREVLGRNSLTTISHDHQDVGGATFHRDLDMALTFGKTRDGIHGVKHKIDKNLLNLGLIARDVESCECRPDLEGDLAPVGFRAQ